MGYVRFVTTAESPNSMTLTFQRNPSFPRGTPIAGPAWIAYRSADGTPYKEEVGVLADVRLIWPANAPMHEDDFADLRTFWTYVRGTQDLFTYRDEDAVDHDAHFMSTPHEFTHEPHGYSGSLELRLRSGVHPGYPQGEPQPVTGPTSDTHGIFVPSLSRRINLRGLPWGLPHEHDPDQAIARIPVRSDVGPSGQPFGQPLHQYAEDRIRLELMHVPDVQYQKLAVVMPLLKDFTVRYSPLGSVSYMADEWVLVSTAADWIQDDATGRWSGVLELWRRGDAY